MALDPRLSPEMQSFMENVRKNYEHLPEAEKQAFLDQLNEQLTGLIRDLKAAQNS